MDFIENRTFDELNVGDTATFERHISWEDVWLYAYLSGDYNPVHLDPEYAAETIFKGPVMHGMFCTALLSSAVATHLPGPGSIFVAQEFKLRNPARVGDHLTGVLTVLEKKRSRNFMLVECVISNQEGKKIFEGVTTVIAPSEKLRVPRTPAPVVHMTLPEGLGGSA